MTPDEQAVERVKARIEATSVDDVLGALLIPLPDLKALVALAQPKPDAAVEREAAFLCARLREFESVCDNPECNREYGHVSPSLARLETALAQPSDEVREMVERLRERLKFHRECVAEYGDVGMKREAAMHKIDAELLVAALERLAS